MKKIIGFLCLVTVLALSSSLVFAQNAAQTVTSTVIPCIGTAVNTREEVILAAATTYTQAILANYTARAAALKDAYSKTSRVEVRTAVKVAWSSYNKSSRAANSAWKKTRDGAWKKFRTSLNACGAPVDLTDIRSSSWEFKGQ